MVCASLTSQCLTTYFGLPASSPLPIQAAEDVGFAEEASELSKVRLQRAAGYAVRGQITRAMWGSRIEALQIWDSRYGISPVVD